jgi:hypothetical protein
MTVYVDDMAAPYKPEHRPGRTYVMCHMIADTEAELHAMAAKIGVARKWYQGDHYDIAKSKRALAVQHGAVELDRRTLGALAVPTKQGQPMGEPATAWERLTTYHNAARPTPTDGAEQP